MSTDADGPSRSTLRTEGFLDAEELAAARSGITSFVRERVDRAGADGVVVGLSGGVDSTLSAMLAVEALGSDRVVGLSMPCHKTDRPDSNEARTIAEGLGIEFEEVSLRPLLDQFEETAADALAATDGRGAPDAAGPEDQRNATRYAVGNAVARMRMLSLYYAANARSLLVLGTANRTELLTGYFTKHGDGGADLFPLGGLYKTEVRALARRVGVPSRIVAKASTAGFWAGQTDVDELGARYADVDALLHRVFDRARPVEAAVEGLEVDRATADDLLERCTDTWHKRRAPPIYRVGRRPAETDRRRDPTGAEAVPNIRETPWSGTDAGADADPLDGHGLDRDGLFQILCDERRRAILSVLYRRGGGIAVPDLVGALVEASGDEPVSPRHRQQVATALVHVHLPRLAGADLIDYDRRERTVRLTDVADRLEPLVAPLLA
ncbi:NAD+ synthase [Halomicrobium salinisoli]|uniref:NAD+ synthase n=1 Tax=Halomicrobium salinisoli TaxID=2878391 RepID=UPI001CF004F8|nr:NAD+ synthase [Halomicrobium salinisoli]